MFLNWSLLRRNYSNLTQWRERELIRSQLQQHNGKISQKFKWESVTSESLKFSFLICNLLKKKNCYWILKKKTNRITITSNLNLGEEILKSWSDPPPPRSARSFLTYCDSVTYAMILPVLCKLKNLNFSLYFSALSHQSGVTSTFIKASISILNNSSSIRSSFKIKAKRIISRINEYSVSILENKFLTVCLLPIFTSK